MCSAPHSVSLNLSRARQKTHQMCLARYVVTCSLSVSFCSTNEPPRADQSERMLQSPHGRMQHNNYSRHSNTSSLDSSVGMCVLCCALECSGENCISAVWRSSRAFYYLMKRTRCSDCCYWSVLYHYTMT